MAGTLFVVATPIGHLDDITLRALRVLGEVAVVAAEDTRRTGNLLRHFGIATRLVSLHAHNEHAKGPSLVARLEAGESVALVSDAGTPGISDPGAALVNLARAAGIRIEAIPGASAVATAVSLAGLGDSGFAFLGFPPIRSKDRKQWFARLAAAYPSMAVVFFEAPHRVRKSLEEVGELVKQPIFVFRELTKVFEETMIGTPESLLERIQEPKGEFTIVVPRLQDADSKPDTLSLDELKLEVGQMIENGARSRREAARQVAERFGLTTKFVYDSTRN